EAPDLVACVKKVSNDRAGIINDAWQIGDHSGIELGEDAVAASHETVKPCSDIVSISPCNHTPVVKAYGKGPIDGGAGYVESSDTAVGSAQEPVTANRVAIVSCDDSFRVDGIRKPHIRSRKLAALQTCAEFMTL